MINIKVSVYNNYRANQPSGEVNPFEWFTKVNEFTYLVKIIRSILDKAERNRLKAKLPAITPCGTFSERKAHKLIKHSGIICIDIDGQDNPQISNFEELKSVLAENKYILFCALSVSGNGLFCFIQIAYPEKHKGHFFSLQEYFKEMGIVIDKGCSDVCRLRGYSYDSNAYINYNAEVYYSTFETSLNTPERNHTVPAPITKSEPTELNSPLDRASLESYFLNPTPLEHIQVIPQSKTEIVRGIISQVLDSETDITDEYKDWFDICCIIKNLFGEDGRNMFHEISSLSEKYCFDIADRLYSSIKQGEYLCNSETLVKIAAKYGLY